MLLVLWISKTHFYEVLLESKGDIQGQLAKAQVQPLTPQGLVFFDLVVKATLEPSPLLVFLLFQENTVGPAALHGLCQ